MMNEASLLLNSITDAGAAHRGALVVSGSHGGLYPAALASHAGLRAVIFNDAGRGLEEAGIAGVRALAKVGMAAAAVDCMSACIGSAADMMDSGRISFANAPAAKLGLSPGMAVPAAVERLREAEIPRERLPRQDEARTDFVLSGISEPVLLVDSASLVKPEDRGRIIVTGSHGGLIGGDPSRALKARAKLAVFNDAGFGKDRIGVSRLPALDLSDIAALTVAHDTARIGDASSSLEAGLVSVLNRTAEHLGIEAGMPLREAIVTISAS